MPLPATVVDYYLLPLPPPPKQGIRLSTTTSIHLVGRRTIIPNSSLQVFTKTLFNSINPTCSTFTIPPPSPNASSLPKSLRLSPPL